LSTASIRVSGSGSVGAITLASGALEATFVPELNMLGTSVRLGGEEFVSLQGGVARYRSRSTTGIPLLAPWANRLASWSYRAARRRVDLSGLDLTTDPNGLPMHGTMWAEPWEVETLTARDRTARLRATFAYERPDLLAAFPYPHRLEMAIANDGRSVSLTTTVRPTGERAVPVSFGFHPYLRLPSGRRSGWRLRLPGRAHLELDEHLIPTGRSVDEPPESLPVGRRTFDDGYELTAGRTLGLESDEHRLTLRFGAGYPFAQVFAPRGAAFVCLEPMTAPTNALASDRYPIVEPGETFTASFSIRPERTASSDALS
jgi:aldose 1-epimerase